MKGIYITATFLEVLGWGNKRFYKYIEQKYAEQGINISVVAVEVIPLEIENHTVRYFVMPISYHEHAS